MTRRRRTQILVENGDALRTALAGEVRAAHEVIEIEPAHEALVMMQMRESAARSRFYIGELLVTEAKVQIGEAIGLGIMAGTDEQAAHDLAIIDAAYNAGLPLTAAWSQRLAEAEAELAASRRDEDATVLQTRVRFDTMEAE